MLEIECLDLHKLPGTYAIMEKQTAMGSRNFLVPRTFLPGLKGPGTFGGKAPFEASPLSAKKSGIFILQTIFFPHLQMLDKSFHQVGQILFNANELLLTIFLNPHSATSRLPFLYLKHQLPGGTIQNHL